MTLHYLLTLKLTLHKMYHMLLVCVCCLSGNSLFGKSILLVFGPVQPNGTEPMMMSLSEDTDTTPTIHITNDLMVLVECGTFKSIISRKMFCVEQESAGEMKSCCENHVVQHSFIAVSGSYRSTTQVVDL